MEQEELTLDDIVQKLKQKYIDKLNEIDKLNTLEERIEAQKQVQDELKKDIEQIYSSSNEKEEDTWTNKHLL